MTFPIPASILDHHIAALGKTGSGKTSTSKLIVEHVVAQGYRVCILDPIKSDWWGITSSADGKKPGLPFNIMGGPHGHVPLPTGQALQAYWLGRLPEGEKRILEALIVAYPDARPRADLDDITGYKRSSRDAYIQRMKSKRLVTISGSSISASETLFEGPK